MAPEQLIENTKFDARIDVWSLGVILHEMLLGKKPFAADTGHELINKITGDQVDFECDDWESVSIEALDLAEYLLKKDPDERLEVMEIKKQSWLLEQSLEDKLM